MSNQKKTKLEAFVSSTLSYSQFINLTNLLDVSPTKLTRIWNNPKEEASLEVVLKLAEIMQIPAHTLVMEYEMGSRTIYSDDMQNLPELQEGFIQIPKSA